MCIHNSRTNRIRARCSCMQPTAEPGQTTIHGQHDGTSPSGGDLRSTHFRTLLPNAREIGFGLSGGEPADIDAAPAAARLVRPVLLACRWRVAARAIDGGGD